MKRKFTYILLLLSLFLIFNRQIYELLLNKKTEDLKKTFQEIDSKQIEENKLKVEEYNFNIIENINPTNIHRKINEEDKKSIIGQLVIPTADINLVIFDGISNSKLLSGVTTMKEDQIMGEGNYALAGHYGFENKLLYNLDQVDIDDEIRITDKNKIYIYKIVKKEVVGPERIDMIEDSRKNLFSENIISIMNCYYEDGVRTGDRFFVIGELVKEMEYDKEVVDRQDSFL